MSERLWELLVNLLVILDCTGIAGSDCCNEEGQ